MSITKLTGKILHATDNKVKYLTHKIINEEEKLPKQKRIWKLIRCIIERNSVAKFYELAFRLCARRSDILHWKFLCICNKLIHHGDSNCKIESCRHINQFRQLFSFLKSRSSGGYPVSDYSQIVIRKLNLFIKYPSLSGSFYSNMTSIVDAKIIQDVVQDLIRFLEIITNFNELVFARVCSIDMMHGYQYKEASMLSLFALITIIEDAAAVNNLLIELFQYLSTNRNVSNIDTLRQRFSNAYQKLQQIFHMAARMKFFENYLKIPEIYEPKTTNAHGSPGQPQPVKLIIEEVVTDRAAESTLSDSEDDLISFDDPDLPVEPLQPIAVTDPNSWAGGKSPLPVTESMQQPFMSPAEVAPFPSEAFCIPGMMLQPWAADCAQELNELRQKVDSLTKLLDEQNKMNSVQTRDLKRLTDVYSRLRQQHIDSLQEMKDLRHKLKEAEKETQSQQLSISKVADVEQQLVALRNENKIEVDRLKAIIDQQQVELADQEVMKQSIETLNRVKALHDQQSLQVEQLDQAMHATIRTIQEAGSKFKVLLERFATTETPAKSSKQLKVDKSILEKCSSLLMAVTKLVFAAKTMQAEIKDVPSVKEQYKQSSRWKNGLLSAAESVKACAILMVEVADGIMSDAKNETAKLIAVAQEVSGSTAQLLVAGRIKGQESESLKELLAAGREVNSATSDLTDTVKSAISLQTEEDDNLAQLTLSQAKREQLDTQARIATLEVNLSQEQKKLAELRKLHYRTDAEFETAAPAYNETAC